MNIVERIDRYLDEIESENKRFGFYGSLKTSFGFSDREVEKIWDNTISIIKKKFNISDKAAKNFLDSSSGRYLSDALEEFKNNSFNAVLKRIEKTVDSNRNLFKSSKLTESWIANEVLPVLGDLKDDGYDISTRKKAIQAIKKSNDSDAQIIAKYLTQISDRDYSQILTYLNEAEEKYYDMELQHKSEKQAEKILIKAGFKKQPNGQYKNRKTGEYAEIKERKDIYQIVIYDRAGKVLGG